MAEVGIDTLEAVDVAFADAVLTAESMVGADDIGVDGQPFGVWWPEFDALEATDADVSAAANLSMAEWPQPATPDLSQNNVSTASAYIPAFNTTSPAHVGAEAVVSSATRIDSGTVIIDPIGDPTVPPVVPPVGGPPVVPPTAPPVTPPPVFAPTIKMEIQSNGYIPLNANKSNGSPWMKVDTVETTHGTKIKVDQVGVPAVRDLDLAPMRDLSKWNGEGMPPNGGPATYIADPDLKKVTITIQNPFPMNYAGIAVISNDFFSSGSIKLWKDAKKETEIGIRSRGGHEYGLTLGALPRS